MAKDCCLILEGRNYSYGFLGRDVLHVQAAAEWWSLNETAAGTGATEAPLDVSRLGVEVRPDLEPLRILTVSNGEESMPLLVRGAIATRSVELDEIVSLPAGPWSRMPFSRVLIHDGKPMAVLLLLEALLGERRSR